MAETEIDFDGHTYRLPGLTPMQAFHVLRRVSPLLVAAGSEILIGLTAKNEEEKARALLSLFVTDSGMKLATMLATMPDADLDFIAQTTLSRVKVKESSEQGTSRWAPVLADGSTLTMFPFVTAPVLLRLIIEVIRKETLPFFSLGPRSSGADPE